MKFNRKTHEKERIINLIEEYYDKDNLELEAIIYGIGSQYRLNYHNFVDTYQRLVADPDMAEVKPLNALNIYFEPTSKYHNIRVTVLGEGSIKNYCSTNSIKNIGYNVKFIKKENYFFGNKMARVDVNDYHIRFNLKNEEELDPDSKIIKELKEDWDDLAKSFRRKQIHTFVTQIGMFRFDMSIVKRSNTVNEKMTIGDVIKHRKQHLVIKPKDTKQSFFDWWTDIKKDKSNKVDVALQPSFYKRIENSNVLTNPETFEIEIELLKIGEIPDLYPVSQDGGAPKKISKSKSKSTKKDDKENKDDKESKKEKAYKPNKATIDQVFNKFVERAGMVLQTVQGSNYIISETQKTEVTKDYQKLINNYSTNLFKGPLPITLELKHIKQYTNRQYQNPDLETIRRDYLVTEKANGERCLLYIAKDNKQYLITRSGKGSQSIKYTGTSLIGHGQTLLDGEYITTDVKGNVVSTFLYFDVYYYRGKDVRHLPLGYHERQTDTRQNIMLKIDQAVKDTNNFVSIDDLNEFTMYRKKYLRGDISNIKGLNPDESTNDTMIFESCNKLLSRMDKIFGGLLDNGHLYSYETDGLIFSPANLGVGQNFKDDDIGVFGKKIWQKTFKWKSHKFNSIDFYVKMRRNIIDKEIIDEYYNGIRYKHVFLQVSYHPEYHNDFYAQRILNEGINHPNIEHYLNFEPINPFHGYIDASGQLINDVQIASIPSNSDGDLLTLEGEIIQEGHVIEFIYDDNESEERFKWKPLRIRENKKANGFHTASNVWRSLNNPVTTEIITTGKCPDDVEFQGLKGQHDKLTKPFRGFSNYVKNKLLQTVTEDINEVSLMDLCCGKIVDLKKWRFNKVKTAVAIDIDTDSIHNHNDGAAVRILKHSESDAELRKLAKQTLLICGDCSKNLFNGNAGCDLLNKYYLDVLYGNHEISGVNPKLEKLWGKGQNKFNIITCNFGIQNFFKDLETVENFMVNIAENLKSNGKFIGICLDGQTMYKELKSTELLQGFSTNNQLLWSIKRNYSPSATYPKNHYSLGYEYNITVDSVEHDSKGYLVHFDFLVDMMNKYGLKLLDSKLFDESPASFLDSFKSEYPKFSEQLTKTKDMVKLASMHRWFIFTKTKSKAMSYGKSSLSSGIFDVSVSSSKSMRRVSMPDPMSETINDKILPEDIEYDEGDSEISEYKSEMSYDYDDSIPSNSDVKKADKKSHKKSLRSVLNEKTKTKTKTKKMEIHKPNVTMTISKKKSK